MLVSKRELVRNLRKLIQREREKLIRGGQLIRKKGAGVVFRDFACLAYI